MSDNFTKWVEAYALPNAEVRTVAKRLVDQFISRYGVPREIHTDQGTPFESALFTELCNLLGVIKTRTSSYHPMSNGQVEIYHRTLESMMSKYVREDHTDWDENLTLLTMAYRATPHSSTKISPYKMFFGQEMNLPIDVMIGKPTPEEEPNEDYVFQLQQRLIKVHADAQAALKRAACQQKATYDERLSFTPIDRTISLALQPSQEERTQFKTPKNVDGTLHNSEVC